MANIIADGDGGENNIQSGYWRREDHVSSNMGDGNDYFSGWGASYDVNGEGGNDIIVAGEAGGTAHGNEGNDSLKTANMYEGFVHNLFGDAGDDNFLAIGHTPEGTFIADGGEGEDRFEDWHAGGSDSFNGGDGFDWVTHLVYNAVNVSLSGGSGGGVATGNTYSSIEGILGSNQGDTVTGDGLANVLSGGNGADTLNGGGGSDLLVGRALSFEEFTGTRNSAPYATNTYSYTESSALWPDGGASDDGAADSLSGDAGDDVLMGGNGADTLDGGSDRDTASYADSNQGVQVDLGAATASGGAATGDVLISIENIYGSRQNDVLTGNAQANHLNGAVGQDTLDGGLGADTLVGGVGDDTFLVDAAGDLVTEAAGGGSDTVRASASYGLGAGQWVEDLRTDNEAGTAAIKLSGNDVAQAITGNAGTNTLNGLGGADTMTGLGGNDSYVVDVVGDQVIEAAGGGTDIVYAALSYTLGTGQSVEVLRTALDASTAAIKLTGNEVAQSLVGNAGANTLNGLGGADTMTGLGGNDAYAVDNAGDQVVEAAGGGSDTVYASVSYTLGTGQLVEDLRTLSNGGTTAIKLTGNEIAQYLYGNAGNNTLNGLGAADTMTGFGGNDSYVVDVAGDQVIEAAGGGTDIVYAAASYTLGTGQSVEVLRTDSDTGTTALKLTGNEVAQYLLGNAGNNTLSGLGGADTMTGFGGNDSYLVDVAGDQVVEAAGGGSDAVYASTSYTLGAGQSVEVLRTFSDTGTTATNLTGNEQANMLIGNAGINILDGGAGKDSLTPGNDTAVDTIRFSAVSHSTSVNRDTVTGMDFNEDKLDFTIVPTSFAVVTTGTLNEGATFDANLATAVNAALAVNGAVLLDPNGGNLNIAGHYYLVVDGNGDGSYTAGSDYVLQIVNPTGTLDLTDFV